MVGKVHTGIVATVVVVADTGGVAGPADGIDDGWSRRAGADVVVAAIAAVVDAVAAVADDFAAVGDVVSMLRITIHWRKAVVTFCTSVAAGIGHMCVMILMFVHFGMVEEATLINIIAAGTAAD